MQEMKNETKIQKRMTKKIFTKKSDESFHLIMDELWDLKPDERKGILASLLVNYCLECGKNVVHKGCGC